MSFDTLAPIYLWMERLAAGNKMQQCRTAFLAEMPEPRRILIAGEGHGRSVMACLQAFPSAQMTCVDISLGMIAQARNALVVQGFEVGRVEFVHADFLSWSPEAEAYDLIVTHYFLDCFTSTQMESVVQKLASAAAPKAAWHIADFQLAKSGWRRVRSVVIVWLLYRFFRLMTHLSASELVSPDARLKSAGFYCHQRVEMEWGLLKSEWWMR